MNIENRPHSKIFVSMGMEIIQIYVEETVDIIERQLNSSSQLDFLTFNVAMLRVNQDFRWTPNCNQEITYVEWHIRKNQVRGFLKRLSPKKVNHLNAKYWSEGE